MPLNQSQRPRFYEEQYLGAADLTAAVDYGRIQQARHALGAHTWGIAAGLQLKEKDVSAGGGQVEVFLQPGYAWDGFGRPIVVLAPYKIPAELFKSIPFANSPAGQLIKVWLRYDESATQRARPGFEVCDRADQFSRVQETFRVEIGERPNHDDRHNPISVAGYLVDAQETLHRLDPTDPQLYDESVPYQNFPDTGAPARWLIPLGAVLWQPNPDLNKPGAFAKRSEDQLKFSRNLRRYIGVVAEAVEAADGRIRMKSRAKEYSPVVSDDLVWVEGDLRVEGDVRLFNHKLDFRDSSGLDYNGIPLSIQRVDLAGAGGSLQVVIGRSDKGDNTFAVGPLVGLLNDTKFDAKLTVHDDGKIGIGTTAPAAKLEIFANWNDEEGALRLTGDKPTIRFTGGAVAGSESWILHLGSDGPGNLQFFRRSGPEKWTNILSLSPGGNVGIGTRTPAYRLDVIDRMRVQQGPAGTAGLWFYQTGPNNDRAFVGMADDDLVGFWGNPGAQFGLVMHTTSLKVGIGLLAPVCKLHVVDSINGDAHDVNAHVAVIENTHGEDHASVLALKVGSNTPTDGNNFITFFGGNNAVGRIEGNGSGGISMLSEGADFAECLPRLRVDETIEAGDIVGVFAGKITKITEGAHHVTAITDRSVVVGNAPHGECEHSYDKVAFLGQIPVKIRGAVRAGDYIIPSGLYDGTGVAVSPDLFRPDLHPQVVGRAWESADGENIKTVNTAIGLALSAPGVALMSLLHAQQEEIAALKVEIHSLATAKLHRDAGAF